MHWRPRRRLTIAACSRLDSPQDLRRNSCPGCRECAACSDPLMKAHNAVRESKGAPDMKYILMMNCPKTGYDTFGAWPKEDIQAHIAFMLGFNKGLRESGELLSAEGLASPHQAKIVRAGKDCAPITDGVFPEAKEF